MKMTEIQTVAGNDIRFLISNSKVPLVFKNIIRWKILDWSLEDWNKMLGAEAMDFRSGLFEATSEPQWERTTTIVKEKFDYFLKLCEVAQPNKWLYYDYKYLRNNLTQCQQLRDEIIWRFLGFPEVTDDDSTIWIGSKGAHTSCHIDTYGCNIIVQVYGRKLWLLFPPDNIHMKPTRIPYEESSIYSKLNFFSPNLDDFDGVKNCYKVVLNAGDVLFLPHRWWHYVENLEAAISINSWLPVDLDNEERLKESIVQFFVKQVATSTDDTSRNLILNPNMEEILCEKSEDILENIIRSRHICHEKGLLQQPSVNLSASACSSFEMEEILKKYNCIQEISPLPEDDFHQFLKEQTNRFGNTKTVVPVINNSSLDILNVLTDSDVVSLIAKKLLLRKK